MIDPLMIDHKHVGQNDPERYFERILCALPDKSKTVQIDKDK